MELLLFRLRTSPNLRAKSANAGDSKKASIALATRLSRESTKRDPAKPTQTIQSTLTAGATASEDHWAARLLIPATQKRSRRADTGDNAITTTGRDSGEALVVVQ